MKQNSKPIRSPFDIPYNPYERAIIRIERFKECCKFIGDKGLTEMFEIGESHNSEKEKIKKIFYSSLEYQKAAKKFLKCNGVMNDDETFVAAFTSQNPNPLIADAAYYFQKGRLK